MSTLFSVDAYREQARTRLPAMVYDYYAGGARDEITLHENTRAYDRLALRYHVMRDVDERTSRFECNPCCRGDLLPVYPSSHP